MLLDALARDGRARWRDLAAATGRSAATARRLVVGWQRGALFFDVDFAPSLLGLRASAAP
ncbi:Lrp/AsnC family transcriptional regulator [Actinomycetospora sp. NBRC 106378]|uniref:Lrp/AsnC family transcriptional regulator n=1 Tax=Actinomycetospora sp. NBRC 106378 TaxID=3032208 RepID=UPI0024A06305|nr:Lrp/AsnC family transcriptional regulator [Actinomycetospora sp. NBRC 106378]GLZ51594.1 hypothetical protein Acsp07_12110 [Actinomycetospora sp. NBRC 106378]